MASGDAIEQLAALLAVPDQLAQIAARLDRIEAGLRARDLPMYVSPKRAAGLLGVSLASVRRRLADGGLRSKRVGNRIVIETATLSIPSEAEIDRLAEEARQP